MDDVVNLIIARGGHPTSVSALGDGALEQW